MKTSFNSTASRLSRLVLSVAALGIVAAPAAHAGLTFELQIFQYGSQGNYTYYFNPQLATNSTGANVSFGNYAVTSFGIPTNGSSSFWQFDTNGFNQTAGDRNSYGDFNSMAHEITNGVWSLFVTNATITNVYYFKVALNISSNGLPKVLITAPLDDAVNVTNQPTFTWQGPANYSSLVVSEFNTSQSLPAAQTSWLSTRVLYQGPNNFNVDYVSNSTTTAVATVPTNTLAQPFSGWVSTNVLDVSYSSQFSVGLPDTSGGVHALVAHYPFDATSGPVLGAATDTSGNGFNMSAGGTFGSQGGDSLTSDSAAGIGAVLFQDGDNNSGAYLGWTDSTPPPLLSALAGSFSLSCWVKTTQNIAWNTAPAYVGAGIVSADDFGLANDVIPIALTGGSIAFNTGGNTEDVTLNSVASVNDGNYHHIVVTRNQITGQKIIYIDGQFDSFASGTTNMLSDPQKLTIGALANAGNPDPNDGSYYQGFDGKLDDLQIYSGVLSASEVAFLYNNPGTNVVDTSGNSQGFNSALDTANLSWVTSGDTSWFVETTNTYNGAPAAAQSGSVTGDQSSTLSVTVTGPGTLTFYWSSQDDCDNFDYEFDIDGNYTNDIYCSRPWVQAGPYGIPVGQHTLSWTADAYGDEDPTEAGFLDQVSYVPDTSPVITLNPFSQTNFPGYPVWLSASATSTPAATWQWYEVGFGAIPGATTASFIPTNSGTAGVAGNYYAIAGNDAGSAITTTAVVSFVSAPLPPGWSLAVKSPFSAEFSYNVIRDYYAGCAVNAAGEVYVADQYVGDVNVQSNFVVLNTLTAAGNNGAAALVKHAADGRPIWAVGLTNNQASSYSYGVCVALAPGNGAYLASALIGTNWLGTNQYANTGGGSILLSRFDANGSNIWSRFIGQSNQVFCQYNGLVADAAGNLTIAGVLNGTADFGGTNLTASGYSGFLAQYNANGGLLWAQVLPGFPQNLAGSAGRIYLALAAVNSGGATNLTLGSLSNLTDRAYGLAAVNATNGQALWLRGVGELYGAKTDGGFPDDIPLVSVSGADVFVTGTAYGATAWFGGLSVPLPGGRYQYFARFDTNGNAQIATNYGSTTTMPWASTANSSGVYISGDFDSFAYFGDFLAAAPVYAQNYLGTNYFTQPFMAKFDRNGNALWVRNGVSSLQANFRGIATASDGVWASGISLVAGITQPAQFGTNTVFSDDYLYNFGTGVIALFTQGGLLTKVTESSAVPTPVALINPKAVGTNFQFQFLSQSGFSHSILYRTNLAIGVWRTNSIVIGDGAVKTSNVPFSLFSPSKQGFIRVSTQ